MPGIKKIGIVGCGAIGSALAKAITARFKKEAKLVALFDIDKNKAVKLAGMLKKPACPSGRRACRQAGKIIVASLDNLIKKSDLVIETASKEISAKVVKKALKRRKDVLVMSVGGLLKNSQLFKLAKKNNCHIFIPSGALCGIDGVKSAGMGRIDEVTLTTRKPPVGFSQAPFVVKNKINLDSLDKDTVIFEGSADEAVEGFPQNINVAAVLSLAGIGAKDTRVKIIASPGKNINSHEVEVKGEFGHLIARTDNVPSPRNPKTSYLAILSAMATLKDIFSSVKIGT